MQHVDGQPPQRFGRRGRSSMQISSSQAAKVDGNGYISSSLWKGLEPHEAVFSSKWTRAAMVDVGSKTKKTGYENRRTVKSLQNIVVAYDRTLRLTDGSIVSFRAHDSCEPGDPVGCHAADSIFEPFTQTALSNYHGGGKSDKRLLGMKRVEEILSAKSKDVNPTIEITGDVSRAVAWLGQHQTWNVLDYVERVYVKKYERDEWWYDVWRECLGEPAPAAHKKQRVVPEADKIHWVVVYRLSKQKLARKRLRIYDVAEKIQRVWEKKKRVSIVHTDDTFADS